MQKKVPFVSGNLHRISEQISEATSGTRSLPHDDSDRTVKIEIDQVTRNAYREKHLELDRLKRDVLSRLNEKDAEYAQEREKTETRLRGQTEFQQKIRDLLSRLESISEPDRESADYIKQLTEIFRSVEKIRLEALRLLASGTASDPKAAPGPQTSFALPDNGELFRKGFYFFLPFILALAGCTLFLSAAIVIAWKLPL